MLGYNSFGNGPNKVVALHGWFGDERTFDPIFGMLSPSDYTWICPAYRGYGASRDVEGDYTIEEIAGDVLALADELGLAQFNLVGHSMGGMAIQRVLANQPGRVTSLVAIAPVPACGAQFDDELYAVFKKASSDPTVAETIVRNSVSGKQPDSFIRRIARNPGNNARKDAFDAYLRSWVETDFQAEIAGMEQDVLVVIGENDPGLNEDVMRATYLSDYPNAKLKVLVNAGHYPVDETPDECAAVIDHFLRRSA